jgi:hypothetical protein
MIEKQSAYIKRPSRLSDVVASLQVMGTYKFASRKIDNWEESMGRAPSSASTWLEVFSDHPEFFCIKDEWISLIWRRASEKTFDTRTGKELTKEEVEQLTPEEKKKISRAPLTPDQVTALIEVAIKLQSQAISRRTELRWWVPLLVGAVGLAVGALLKS